MFFFKNSEEKKKRKQQQAACRQALEAGGIPPVARERIERQIASGSKLFTSDLTAREYLLSREIGLTPLGQVMGTSFVKVSVFSSFFRVRLSTQELKAVSHAQLDARHKAVNRLLEEAKLMGASGVVGVRIKAGPRDWNSDLMEFTAIGTAVRIPDWKHETFACDLSAQEFWQLHAAGYRPCGIAFGCCSYYMAQDMRTTSQMYSWWGGNNWNNQEINLFTQGFYTARHLSIQRLEKDLNETLADGIVGVEIDYDFEKIDWDSEERRGRWDLVTHFTAMGTGIIKDETVGRPEVMKPSLCINLSDLPLAPARPSRMKEIGSSVMADPQAELYKMLLEKLEDD